MVVKKIKIVSTLSVIIIFLVACAKSDSSSSGTTTTSTTALVWDQGSWDSHNWQ